METDFDRGHVAGYAQRKVDERSNLLALSTKWRKEADVMEEVAKCETNRLGAVCFNAAAQRIRRMAEELDTLSS